ncbi:hypothetical protein J31TS4_09600 [Paenibacillus sp. J31TS4]|uniref:response regulator transcription factor n=1 Tax=Paenibacillus sp. J31TS4 TaxID=2807195 RepID=UPI001B100C06|nr:response regulator [Paenibacillus sp. J31TS4]GIP37680.1 hypothetical protein J31TS4_09600 [Paenibacillus sp. J31TS4]
MNLLIVEDEHRLRNSLANNIPWEEHGIEVVGLAATGSEAVQLFQRKKPDLLLLDIQIPEMDGLALARHVSGLDRNVKMIILSGHDNFEYAQSALEMGIYRYLLKPAGDTEILQAVVDAADQLRRELDERRDRLAMQVRWEQHLPGLRNDFLRRWLTGQFDLSQIVAKSAELQLPVREGQRFAVAVLDMDPIGEAETRFGPNDAGLLRYSLQLLAQELLEGDSCWVSGTDEGMTALLCWGYEEEEPNEGLLRLHVTVDRLLSQIRECLKLTASAGICGSLGGPEEVGRLYQQAMRALQDRVVYGHNLAIPYREETGEEERPVSQPNLEKQLEIALETGEEARAMEALDELWNSGMAQAKTMEAAYDHLLYLSSILLGIVQRGGWPIREVAGEEAGTFLQLQQLATKEQIYAWLQRMVRQIAAHNRNQRKSSSHQIVKAILTMVDEEMDKEITLHTAADRLYVNSSYLSRLFKQETGKPFSQYVLERKMERAKAVLLSGAKVYDAANVVGYRDVSYFTKVFRKYWGITPGECKP